MWDNRTSPSSTSRRPGRGRRTILLTGASGVVGQALLPRLARLADTEVICLVHSTPVAGALTVKGDLTQARVGLSGIEYADLVRRVDVVVHSGAVTDFNRSDGSLEATNIGGTEQIVALAEAAGAPIYHVSTAFIDAVADGDRGRTAARYAASKRAGEAVVRAATVPHTILRPSIVIGHSRTGYIASFQGFYLVAAALLGGFVPLIPFDASWPIDFLPSDVVADAIATAVAEEVHDGELWVTAGSRALTIEQTVGEVVDYGARIGTVVDVPRFVPPETFDRLIAPVFLDALPRRVRLTVNRLLDAFTIYLARETAMPSDLDQRDLPDPGAALRSSLGYWAETTGRLAPVSAEVA